MQGLLPTPPDFRGRAHKHHTILKPHVYQMVLHRPIECTASDLMRVRWTPAATDDLRNIANYLFEKTADHAPFDPQGLHRSIQPYGFPNTKG
jgi:hypothetical protein